MNNKIISIAIILVVILFISCKKETEEHIIVEIPLGVCVDCQSLAVHGDFVYVLKSDKILKIDTTKDKGNFVEVLDGLVNAQIMAFVGDILYIYQQDQKFYKVDVNEDEPRLDFFMYLSVGNISDLIAYGDDLIVGYHYEEEIGAVMKLTTIGTPSTSSIIGNSNGNMEWSFAIENNKLNASSGSFWFNNNTVQVVDLNTLETNLIYNSESPADPFVLASKGDGYIYNVYNKDIYRYKANETFNQEIIYKFAQKSEILDMEFLNNDLYFIKNNWLKKVVLN